MKYQEFEHGLFEDLCHEEIEVRKLGEGVVWKIRIQFKKILCVCLPALVYVYHVWWSAHQRQTRVSHMYPLQLELEAFVSCPVDCREENLGLSARAVSALKPQSHLRINISNISTHFGPIFFTFLLKIEK